MFTMCVEGVGERERGLEEGKGKEKRGKEGREKVKGGREEKGREGKGGEGNRGEGKEAGVIMIRAILEAANHN
jgi:hypothetical protein